MREVCFGRRAGVVEDREPVHAAGAAWPLACLRCGHLDHLSGLTPATRRRHAAGRPTGVVRRTPGQRDTR